MLDSRRFGSAVVDSRRDTVGAASTLVFREVLAKHFAQQLAEGICYMHSLGRLGRVGRMGSHQCEGGVVGAHFR